MGILCFLLIKKIFDKEALLKKRLIKIAGLGLIIFGILLACMLMWQFGLYSLLAQIPYVNAKYYAWGLAFSCLTIGLLLYPSKIFVNRVTKFLGVRSYSIYLIHPVVAAIFFDSGIYNTIYYGLYGESGYIALLVCILLTFCVVMILSSISYWLIEKPIIEQGSTARLEWLKSKIIRKNS
jgi:peptidoglycan/LPS O-acetylase OafA/YrhL